MHSPNIVTYKEITQLIEYCTHFEGMGTYASLYLRKKGNLGRFDFDSDYLALEDDLQMKIFEKEYFEIYNYFKNSPESIITDEDWVKISVLSDKKRLWHRVGAHMAKEIEKNYGRKKIVSLILEPSGNFINTYILVNKN